MKLFKNAAGTVYAFEPDGSQDAFITPDMVPTTLAEIGAAPTLEERMAGLLRAVDAHLDAAAQTRRYDNIRSAALRAAYPGQWHDEGVAYATWMDACYARCYELLAQFEAGAIAEPTEAEMIVALPALVLPV